MKHLLLLLFLFTSYVIIAQDQNLRYEDYIYKNNIKTVQFHVDGLFTSYPIIELGSPSALLFSFDDIDGDTKNYTYTIVHCDMNWQPSNLAEMEYLDGFIEEWLDRFQFSFTAINPYTHYWLYLPNAKMNWLKSGNYLLKVYENEGDKTLAITRRFTVVEPLLRILPQMMRPAAPSKQRTHQEIDFIAENISKTEIRRPLQELKAVILQNGRWDSTIKDMPPYFVRNNQFIFDYQDRISFPAGKEFRDLDLRSLRFRSENIALIERFDGNYEVTLLKDLKRATDSYFQQQDINGQFVIESFDQDSLDHNLSNDYANVLFNLYSPEPLYDYDVYVYGELSDWHLDERFKMIYNPAVNGYVGKIRLKQGYYEYAYAVAPRNGKDRTPNLTEIEGNWHETENHYTIFIYYRPFGERYDRVIGVINFTSNF